MDTKQKIIARESAKPGFRGPINAKCCECIYDDHDAGTWRQQVERCVATDCPLHKVRPTSTSEEAA